MEPRYLPEHAIVEPRGKLVRHTVDMAEVLFRAVARDRARLAAQLPWPDAIQCVADERAYIEDARRQWDARTRFDYALFCDETYAGNLSVHTIDWQAACCELGYWVVGECEGQGLVSQGVRALEAVVFGLGFHRIEIQCNADNVRSSAVAERNGYQFEARLRENRFERGAYQDTLVYAKLASDTP